MFLAHVAPGRIRQAGIDARDGFRKAWHLSPAWIIPPGDRIACFRRPAPGRQAWLTAALQPSRIPVARRITRGVDLRTADSSSCTGTDRRAKLITMMVITYSMRQAGERNGDS